MKSWTHGTGQVSPVGRQVVFTNLKQQENELHSFSGGSTGGMSPEYSTSAIFQYVRIRGENVGGMGDFYQSKTLSQAKFPEFAYFLVHC